MSLYTPNHAAAAKGYKEALERFWAKEKGGVDLKSLIHYDEVKDDWPAIFLLEQQEPDPQWGHCWMRTIMFMQPSSGRPAIYRERVGDAGAYDKSFRIVGGYADGGKWVSCNTIGQLKDEINKVRNLHGSAKEELSEVEGEVASRQEELVKEYS